MSYSIGVAALLEGKAFNIVRSLEVAINEKLPKASSLNQPPHVTIKRPFVVNTRQDIEHVSRLINLVVSDEKSFNIEYNGVDSFSDKALIMPLKKPLTELKSLHRRLVGELSRFYDCRVNFEGDAMIYHTSLATNLKGRDIETAKAAIAEMTIPEGAVSIDKIGLFLNTNNGSEWVIIEEIHLSKS